MRQAPNGHSADLQYKQEQQRRADGLQQNEAQEHLAVRPAQVLARMIVERVADTTLIRHAYVDTGSQGKGIGSTLLKFIEKQVDTEWLLVGVWQAASWALAFYRKHGYEVMERKDDLLRRYWDIPDCQIETSVVLGKRMRSL